MRQSVTWPASEPAHRAWTPVQIGFLANVVRLYREEELDFTLGGKEAETKIREVFGKKPKFADVLDLCKAATVKEISAQSWSLNPGRYVGVAPGESVSDEDFKETLEALNEELEALNAQAHELERVLSRRTSPRCSNRNYVELAQGQARRVRGSAGGVSVQESTLHG